MPNIESERSHAKNDRQESNNLFQDAYSFGENMGKDAEGRLRQLHLIGYGAIVGGVKDIPNEFLHHTWETVGKLAVGGTAGAGLAAALAADSPLIVGGATAVSVVFATASLWHTYVECGLNKKLQQSLNTVYKSGDGKVFDTSKQIASDVIGPEAFNYGIGMATSFASMCGPKIYERLPLNFLKNSLRSYTPIAVTQSDEPAYMIFDNNSAIHMHGGQGILQNDGWEHDLKVSENGIHMEILRTLTGRQVLKALLDGHNPKSGKEAYIKMDYTPKTGITKMSSDISPSYIHAEKFSTHPSTWIWSSCRACQEEDELIDKSPIKPYE